MKAARIRIGKVELTPHVPTLIAPFTDRTSAAELRRARAQGLRLAEARVDLFEHREPSAVRAVLRAAAKTLPVLLTLRASREGGEWHGDDAGRLALYRTLMPLVSAVDVELDAAIRADVVRAARRARRTVVLSHHDFRRTPSPAALDAVIRRGRKAGADVVKIATLVADDRDVARLATLFSRHPRAALVLIGMGEHGKKTRVLFPALGSLFTFASLGRATAPGQLDLAQTVAELRRYFPDFSRA